MEIAFRTNIDTINCLKKDMSDSVGNNFKTKKAIFKKSIRQLIQPEQGILNGSTIKDVYFPSTTLDGFRYDFFISHSHKDEEAAIILATWLETYYDCSCFIDSLVWKSADELLKEIDDRYCFRKYTKTYDYKKRNFTTSHVHAILSMALLDTIKKSKYCIFIESDESISLENGLRKKTFSPWLYEEIKFMSIFQPKKDTKCFSNSLNESFKMKFDVSEVEKFPFLDVYKLNDFKSLSKREFGKSNTY